MAEWQLASGDCRQYSGRRMSALFHYLYDIYYFVSLLLYYLIDTSRDDKKNNNTVNGDNVATLIDNT